MASIPSTIAGITFPSTPSIQAALSHINAKNLPSTVHHCLRSAIFSLIITSKHPALAAVNTEELLLSILLHDLGWSTSPECTSTDKRFEVDGANAAVAYLKKEGSGISESSLQTVWYAIALHATPSVALHAEPLVVAAAFGIMADFLGPHTPGGMVTEGEFREVLKEYPRVGFKEDTLEIFCGLCKNKPQTTYDNFVGDMGRKLVDGYAEEWEKWRFDQWIWKALQANEVYET
jgi:hypothetical protein